MPPTIIHNASIVLEDRVLERGALIIQGQQIAEVVPDISLANRLPGATLLDAQGAYVMPGFIDTHSDNIERVIQPRPQSMIDFYLAMREQEKELVNQGITTMYHSLSISETTKKSAVRTPDNMRRLSAHIRAMHENVHLIRHRFHCRFDMCNLTDFGMMLELLQEGYIHYLSFTDHTPGQGQYRDLEFFKGHVMQQDLSDEEKDKRLLERMNRPRLSPDQLEKAAAIAARFNVPIASHDDDSIEKLEFVTRVMGARISEFPVELSIAKEARARGMQVVVGAPNVLMGRSHSNNLSATLAIQEGCADILVSDYFPPAILHAVFKLYQDGVLPLHEAVKMATLNPAQAMGTGEQLGSIAPGKVADLLIVNAGGALPTVTDVFIDGQHVSSLRYRENRAMEAEVLNVG
jgi:alpha-D-ribose 1-methylphosphonate 5-triphosphate diphosphatase